MASPATSNQPKDCPVIKGSGGGGYPNNIASTQTKKISGTGAATKGTHYSKNSD